MKQNNLDTIPRDDDQVLPNERPDEALQPPRRHHIGQIIKWLLVVLIVTGVGFGSWLGYEASRVSSAPFSLAGLSTDTTGRTNILVLGDGDPGHAGEGLTDTIMVLSLNTKTHQVAQISVPRDLRVNIPGYGYGKINAANAYGGVTLAEQTVSNTLGIPINYYILTDFDGLKGIVDAVGGLDVDVKTALIDTDYPCDDNQYAVCGLNIQPGLQHMDGARVLQYTRCRKGTCGNDFGRAARQQEILGLLRTKALRASTLLNPVKLSRLALAIRSTLMTNLSSVQLGQTAYGWQRAQSHSPVQLVFSTSPGGYLTSSGASSDLLPADGTFRAIQDRVQNIFTEPTNKGDSPSS